MAVATSCAVCKWRGTAYNQVHSSSFSPGPGGQENHMYVSGRVTAKQDFEEVHLGDLASPLVAQRMPFWQVMDTDINVWTDQKARFTAIVGLGHADRVPDQDGNPSGALSLLHRVGTDRFAIRLARTKGPPRRASPRAREGARGRERRGRGGETTHPPPSGPVC